MENNRCDLIIIGAGLTGLSLAYYLKDRNWSIKILEARDRIGGRIHTIRSAGFAPTEMGATWLGQKHTDLLELLRALDIDIFEQQLGQTAIYEPISTSPPQLVRLPPNDAPSYRIKHGTSTLIQQLAESIKNSCDLHLEQAVQSIEVSEKSVSVRTKTQSFECKKVVATIPPFLLLKNIHLQPPLPAAMQKVMRQTHTWMGESIKVGLHYSTPFWRAKNLSGTIFSSVGPISELYDHSNFEDNQYALKGFLNSSYYTLTKDERLQLVLRQLRKYFGLLADDYLAYEEAIWRKEDFTYQAYEDHVLPHQNNGHSVFRQQYFNGKFFVAGSETATAFPGYMNGAVSSARLVADFLLEATDKPITNLCE
ncbi:MAG: NAD(P)/FAD-dependent oxidoreductase [Bacteroidota bacterium]